MRSVCSQRRRYNVRGAMRGNSTYSGRSPSKCRSADPHSGFRAAAACHSSASGAALPALSYLPSHGDRAKEEGNRVIDQRLDANANHDEKSVVKVQ